MEGVAAVHRWASLEKAKGMPEALRHLRLYAIYRMLGTLFS
jgi:hypothetical protein